MMVPVLYCTCIMAIMAATFVLFVALRLWQHGVQKRPFRAHAKETQDAEEVRLPCCATQITAAREPYTWGFLVQSWCMRCAMWGIYSKCLSEAIVCISAMNVQDTALSMCT